MAKPSLAALWNAFPLHGEYRTMGDLYRALGGVAERNINVSGFGENGNTCASRLSVAFNRGGSPISGAVAQAVGARTLGTANGSRIIYGVVDFRNYLLRVLGRPEVDEASPFDSAFRGRRGIVAFRVNWGNATGHIALWNGRNYREASDNYATFNDGVARTNRGEFWELP